MQKIWKLKGFVCGFIVAVILFTTITAFAESYNKVARDYSLKDITALYCDIKIMVDGKEVKPTDSRGNKIQPFLSGGIVYVPVRFIGQATGKNVTWDDKNFIVYIGSTNTKEKKSYPTSKEEVESKYATTKVTKEQYDKIEMGMSYDEVCEIFGSPGKMQVTSWLIDCVNYSWDCEPYWDKVNGIIMEINTVSITFEIDPFKLESNHKVFSKSGFGEFEDALD